ncbi:MAG TPA: response regulator [candidate division Zixibacteria bacterium]|jgi:DNA-binding response OmpR family regulator
MMPQGFRKKKILIVDDELLIRDLLYDYFIGCDYDIAVAECGQRALDLMNKSSFDSAILDIRMPDIDGLELADRMRAADADLPIIFMTGFPSVETAVAAIRKHADDYFIKPFNVKHLHKSVENAMARVTSQASAGRAGGDVS